MPDTDGDSIEDGWEYYFWYYAKIGFVDSTGKWGRLEGRRFNMARPDWSERISPEEIAEKFHPLKPRTDVGGDTHGDG